MEENFPGARQFRVQGDIILFLRDENNKNKRHDPPRIAHYPDDVIEIFTVTRSPDSNSAPGSAFVGIHTELQSQSYHPTHNLAMHCLRRQKLLPCSNSQNRVAQHPTELRAASNVTAEIRHTPMSPHFSALFSRASANPVTLKKEIEAVNFRISTATDPKSENYGELLKYLSNLIHQQSIILQQNNQYQHQQHQHTHHLQNHALSKLDVMDRKLDAILVQNYELHEYTIPRFFVVLPESFDKWDPRSLMMGKYRLYFLCECDAHSTEYQGSGNSSNPNTSATPSPHRRVHLHNHKGYRISRPNDFLEQFGPYVLGMLKVLSYCLRAATIAAPATGLIKEAVQDTMQGIKAITKNTLENAVNGSISFLKQKLDEGGITASSSSSNPDGFDPDDPFQSVVGLEGADLRRLRTFLRYNDGDETLGNLYRTTTTEGHVKWACLRHHRQSYRDATMLSFLNMLRDNDGEYDPFLRKVTITLTSSAAAKTFFDTLPLDVVFDWSFWPSDLEFLVKAIFQSTVKNLELDLKDSVDDKVSKLGIRIFSKNKYQPLLDLLCNKRLQGLSISGAGQFGLRISDFPAIQNFSSLRNFHFLHRFRTAEQQALMKILTFCPNLADLRLGDFIYWSKIRQELAAVIAAMTHLRTLHLYGVRTESGGYISGILSAFATRGCLKELVCYVGRVNERELSEAIRSLPRTLEVLVVEQVQTPLLDLVLVVPAASVAGESRYSTPFNPGLLQAPSSPTLLSAPFSRLTHLDLNAQLTPISIDFLASALMDLNLVHLGITSHTKDLLSHVNFNTLRSISLLKFEEADLSPLFDYTRSCTSHQCQLETLSLLLCNFASIWPIASLLSTLALKRLQLSLLSSTELKAVLDALNISRLEVLMLVRCQYDWTTEEILAVKRAKFTRQLMLRLCLSDEYQIP
ncbi:hypothetical protein EC991_001071 [Linnemannia zychae]|nr:hypothetical protein EC991_001071 [Linnemannia zychae]